MFAPYLWQMRQTFVKYFDIVKYVSHMLHMLTHLSYLSTSYEMFETYAPYRCGSPLRRFFAPYMLRLIFASEVFRVQGCSGMRGFGLGPIDSISTWLGISVSILLRASGPETHAGPAACT